MSLPQEDQDISKTLQESRKTTLLESSVTMHFWDNLMDFKGFTSLKKEDFSTCRGENNPLNFSVLLWCITTPTQQMKTKMFKLIC